MSLNRIGRTATGGWDGHFNVQRWEKFIDCPGRASSGYKCEEAKHGAFGLKGIYHARMRLEPETTGGIEVYLRTAHPETRDLYGLDRYSPIVVQTGWTTHSGHLTDLLGQVPVSGS